MMYINFSNAYEEICNAFIKTLGLTASKLTLNNISKEIYPRPIGEMINNTQASLSIDNVKPFYIANEYTGSKPSDNYSTQMMQFDMAINVYGSDQNGPITTTTAFNICFYINSILSTKRFQAMMQNLGINILSTVPPKKINIKNLSKKSANTAAICFQTIIKCYIIAKTENNVFEEDYPAQHITVNGDINNEIFFTITQDI